jgi:hypothetical protein
MPHFLDHTLQVQCFVQEHVGQLLPPIAVAARQKLALYIQLRQDGNTQAAEQHSTEYQTYTLAQAQFLCRLAGQEALTRHAPALLNVRHIPRQLTSLVQQAGLQVTAANLVAAARARVDGLESWVVQPYCLQLGPLEQAICCSQAVSTALHCWCDEPSTTAN